MFIEFWWPSVSPCGSVGEVLFLSVSVLWKQSRCWEVGKKHPSNNTDAREPYSCAVQVQRWIYDLSLTRCRRVKKLISLCLKVSFQKQRMRRSPRRPLTRWLSFSKALVMKHSLEQTMMSLSLWVCFLFILWNVSDCSTGSVCSPLNRLIWHQSLGGFSNSQEGSILWISSIQKNKTKQNKKTDVVFR